MAMRQVLLFFCFMVLYACGVKNSSEPINSFRMNHDQILTPAELSKVTVRSASDYRKVLQQIDAADLSSLDAAKNIFLKSSSDSIVSDSMFVSFYDFYTRLADIYIESNEQVALQLANNKSHTLLSFNFASRGLKLVSDRELFSLARQNSYLLKEFGPRLSSSFREFLTISIKEQDIPFQKSGKIVIPSDSLASRILTWENFMGRYPDFIELRLAQDEYTQYLGAYLSGTDNARAFNSNTSQLQDSLKLSLESFVLNNPESKSANLVKDYLEMLKGTNFNYTEKVDSFLLEKVYH